MSTANAVTAAAAAGSCGASASACCYKTNASSVVCKAPPRPLFAAALPCHTLFTLAGPKKFLELTKFVDPYIYSQVCSSGYFLGSPTISFMREFWGYAPKLRDCHISHEKGSEGKTQRFLFWGG